MKSPRRMPFVNILAPIVLSVAAASTISPFVSAQTVTGRTAPPLKNETAKALNAASPADVAKNKNAASSLSKYDALLMSSSARDEKRDAIRAKLQALSMKEVREFSMAMKPRLASFDDIRVALIASFQVLSRRADLDPSVASEILTSLEASPLPAKNFESQPLRAAQERDLVTRLRARAGLLTSARIDAELKAVQNETIPSTVRLAHLAALIDATEATRIRPTLAQLETLLKNDDFEIRILAVDWFRMVPLLDLKERNRFLKQALQTKPSGVREHALRTIASWSAQEIADVSKISPVLPVDCEKDVSVDVRRACADARAKATAP